MFAQAVAAVAILVMAHAPAWGSPPRAAPVCRADRHVEEAQPGPAFTLCVIGDHARREGAFMVLDAFVKNVSTEAVADAEVSVEFYTSSGHLVDVEDSVVRPDGLDPGQKGTVLVVAPYHAGIDKIRYLLTWRQGASEHYGAADQLIALG